MRINNAVDGNYSGTIRFTGVQHKAKLSSFVFHSKFYFSGNKSTNSELIYTSIINQSVLLTTTNWAVVNTQFS